jgi:predicted nucleic acid-binding protein
VVDASVVVSALLDDGQEGQWSAKVLLSDALLVPHVAPAEVSNGLRRAVLGGQISQDIGDLAQADLQRLSFELFPFAPFAARVWELRENVTAYDAWYVALAERAGCALATLDRALASAHGPACEMLMP